MTYAEYLKSLGTPDETIKILDVPEARKGFETMQSQVAESERLRAIAVADKQKIDAWYQETAVPEFTGMQRELVAAKATAAAAREALLSAQDEGLAKLAEQLGWKRDQLTPPAGGTGTGTGTPPGFDPSKYLTREEAIALANREGEAIALVQDIAMEHVRLFPNQSLNFQELRREAAAANKPFLQHWMEKYNVAGARSAAQAAQQKAHDDAIADRVRKEVTAELVDRMAHPDLRVPSLSTSPFTGSKERNREKQPWEVGDRSNERVQRAVQNVLRESGSGPRTN